MKKEGGKTEVEGANPASIEAWVRSAQHGDVAAFRELYDRYGRRILNFVFRMVPSIEEAEDITQETFVAAYQKLGTLKDEAKFEPWLFRIARNFVYQRYRGRPPSMVSIDDVDEDGIPAALPADSRKNPEEAFQSGELARVVERVIRELPDKYREVFVLAALQRLSYRDIARIVRRGLGSVKTDIHRARLQVRKHIKAYLGAG